jgi:hypothetical protein
MLTAVKARLLRSPLFRDSYLEARQALEMLPKRRRYRRQYGMRIPQAVAEGAAALRRDGMLVLPGFLAPEAIADMRRAMDAAIQQGNYRYGAGQFAFEEPPADIHAVARMSVLDATLHSGRFVEYALSEFIHGIISAYLGVDAIVSGVVAYRTQPTREPAKGAFLWHYDNAPLQVKAIAYLTDVATDDGPFAYVKGTHGKRPLEADYEETRLDESQVPAEGRTECTATAGTVLIVDTTGIHRATPNARGTRDVVSAIYDVGIKVRQPSYYNMPITSQVLRTLRPEQRRRLGIAEHCAY